MASRKGILTTACAFALLWSAAARADLNGDAWNAVMVHYNQVVGPGCYEEFPTNPGWENCVRTRMAEMGSSAASVYYSRLAVYSASNYSSICAGLPGGCTGFAETMNYNMHVMNHVAMFLNSWNGG